MPIINIDMWAGRSVEVKEMLIRNITKTVCDTVAARPRP